MSPALAARIMRQQSSALIFALALGSLSSACDQRRAEPQTVPSVSEPSPNASILPAPLAASPAKASLRDAAHPSADLPSDAGVPEPPRALREDDVLPEEIELRAAPGLLLEARFRWLEPLPARSPEGNADALAKAREKLGFDVTLELSSLGRLRLVFDSRSFVFARGSELRAREDRYGHALIWPNATAYTPIPPGALRAVLGDARLDATPLSEPAVVSSGSGSVLGNTTQKQRLETSIGRLELEQMPTATPNAGGMLWCRLLVELLAVAPELSACRADSVPLHAEYTWASGARFEVEVTRLTKKPELAAYDLLVPPAGAELRRGELPVGPFVALVDERELTDFRTRALPPPEKPDPSAPKLGLVFQNRSDRPRYLLVDGVPVVWLRADAEWLVSGLKPGRYSVQSRDFFGAESSPLRLLELPARLLVGEEPERTPH
ncbi:MAG TPA: hypothetical protein VIW29_03845 [Polyangiaceae bacterium]